MSENEPNDTGNESTEGADGAEDQQPDTGAKAGGDDLEKWKALARKHEQRAKENADKAQQYDQYVESQKSETQKLADAKAAAEKAAAEKAAEAAVLRAAVKYSLTEDDLELLEGVPADQVDARAQKISERLGGNGKKFPDLGQGDRGKAGPAKQDMNSMIRAASGRTAS